ncbi:putative manganese-dependent inorganic diphosphatase [Alkalibacter saccharofermentans]|uniref:inorganic diphosphatase n=1 Tax=Alkalibacter saccharofermentans DSM 14828 TaxID=1120975 RepID=A0A1M4XKL4_9FIRM|nr:putative manganese-dependent inorganic diphosphatase [Alkalibacter saccharofermentans]SHE94045.1 manganese-dependent inorganic pyrophosphatase [Alkalibacter saccharofermentans DSM 14828]
MSEIMIFGHKNPDTDSVTSAIVMSKFKNKIGFNTKPFILDEMSKESKYVLDYFGVEEPEILDNVKIQMKDLNYDRVKAFTHDNSIYDAYLHMGKNRVRTLPVVDDIGKLSGILTMKDIAMSLINSDQRRIETTFDNILEGMKGRVINKCADDLSGDVMVTAFHLDTIEEMQLFTENSIVIVGDRFDIIKFAIEKKVKLIIVTGKAELDEKITRAAKDNRVNMILTKFDTYEATKTIFLTNFVKNIMVKENILSFSEEDYLDDCRDIIKDSDHSKFPLVGKNGKYLGIVSRSHIISPAKKRVILVDHNEYAQSAEGIFEADILEVVDHHKIGDISTTLPIAFRNQPVGSTNTILYNMFREAGIEMEKEEAGLMLSGIVSDTLLLKSPTTTENDIEAVENLVKVTGIDLNDFAMEMFKKGTDISGKSVEEVFFSDYKEFVLEGMKTGISQVFTLNIDAISENVEEYLSFINNLNKNRNHYLTLCIITDIIKQGSYILYNANNKSIDSIFEKEMYQGIFIDGWVSRKKQIIPVISEGIKKIINK